MFWSVDGPISRRVHVKWTRREQTQPDREWSLLAAEDTDAEWWIRNRVHYIRYHSGLDTKAQAEAAERSDSRGRRGALAHSQSGRRQSMATLKVEPSRLTLLTRGDVEWRQVFERGQTHHSVLRAQGIQIPVAVTTTSLHMDVQSDSGRMEISYLAEMADILQLVKLVFEFHSI